MPGIKSALEAPTRRLLAREAGRGNADRPGLGAGRACERLSLHFGNLVGSVGMQALFDRSLALVQVDYPWLAPAGGASTESRCTRLQARLDAQDPAASDEAAVELVTTLLALVGRFIGDELVTKILADLYPDLS